MPRRAMKGPNCLVRELTTINDQCPMNGRHRLNDECRVKHKSAPLTFIRFSLFFHQLDQLILQLRASGLVVDFVDLAFRELIVQRGDLIDQGFLLNGHAAVNGGLLLLAALPEHKAHRANDDQPNAEQDAPIEWRRRPARS